MLPIQIARPTHEALLLQTDANTMDMKLQNLAIDNLFDSKLLQILANGIRVGQTQLLALISQILCVVFGSWMFLDPSNIMFPMS